MTTKPLKYLERLPKKTISKPYPAVILLHGYGSNEADLFSFSSELPDPLHIFSPRAPFEIEYNSFAWYNINFYADQSKFSDLKEAKVSLSKINTFIDKIITTKNIDKDNIFLIGFSQGAVLSYSLSLNTNKIKHVVALSGYLEENLIERDKTAPNSLKNRVDYFISHGSLDEVIPIEWARKASLFLNDLSISNIFREYAVGHTVDPQNFYDFKNWIEERL